MRGHPSLRSEQGCSPRKRIPRNNAMTLDRTSRPRLLSMRRLALLATVVGGLTAGGMMVAPSFAPYAPPAIAQNLSQEAQRVARPTGFADIVEKVKPAVISVRVKMRNNP